MVPQTALGKIFGVVVMASGILFMAMPIAILGRDYVIQYDALRSKRHERVVRVRRGFDAINKHLVGAKTETVESCMSGFRHWRNVALWELKLEREVNMPKVRLMLEQWREGNLNPSRKDDLTLQAHSTEATHQFRLGMIQRRKEIVQKMESFIQNTLQENASAMASFMSKELRKSAKIGNMHNRRDSGVPSEFSMEHNNKKT